MHHQPQMGSQDTRTTCAISPKGKARTHGPHAPSVLKAKLKYSDCICHVLEFCTLSRGGGVLQSGNQDTTKITNYPHVIYTTAYYHKLKGCTIQDYIVLYTNSNNHKYYLYTLVSHTLLYNVQYHKVPQYTLKYLLVVLLFLINIHPTL